MACVGAVAGSGLVLGAALGSVGAVVVGVFITWFGSFEFGFGWFLGDISGVMSFLVGLCIDSSIILQDLLMFTLFVSVCLWFWLSFSARYSG